MQFPRATRLTVTVDLEEDGPVSDGGRGLGFRALGSVGWQLEQDGKVVDAARGHTVYRDVRPPLAGEWGPVRLMCAILDYRYARYASADTQMIHPFIHRGLVRDVQIWLPGVEYEAGGGPSAVTRRATAVPVVLKVFPLMSWFWIGLVMMLVGVAWRFAAEGYARPR